GAELRHRRLADHDRTRRAQPPDDLAVGRGRGRVRLAAERRDQALDVHLLLDGDRYAVQRASVGLAGLVDRGGLGQRLLTADHGERVEPRVPLGDPLQRGLDVEYRLEPAGVRLLDGLGDTEDRCGISHAGETMAGGTAGWSGPAVERRADTRGARRPPGALP